MNPLFIYVAMELVEALFAANIQFEYILSDMEDITENKPAYGVGYLMSYWIVGYPLKVYAQRFMLLFIWFFGLGSVKLCMITKSS